MAAYDDGPPVGGQLVSTSKPEGYAPDMLSEQSRLAQFGARALEILRGMQPIEAWEARAYQHPQAREERARLHKLDNVESAARALDLLVDVEAR